jgi:hypothetical protein
MDDVADELALHGIEPATPDRRSVASEREEAERVVEVAVRQRDPGDRRVARSARVEERAALELAADVVEARAARAAGGCRPVSHGARRTIPRPA